MPSADPRLRRIEAHDGGAFNAYCTLPAAGNGPGVLLFHEIFGVNHNIRGLAHRLADAGYLTLAPDLFWRIQPGFERNDETAIPDCRAMLQKLDWTAAAADITSAFAHLLAMPECRGAVGGVGFCLGGTFSYIFATSCRMDIRGPDAVVSYYGSGVNSRLDQAGSIKCPIMFHYGSRDPYIPPDQIAAVEAAVAGRTDVAFHRYNAGHAFANPDAVSMYDAEAADLAWSRTLDFLARHL
jgi:carboxymethylenebutenolidase